MAVWARNNVLFLESTSKKRQKFINTRNYNFMITYLYEIQLPGRDKCNAVTKFE